MEQMAKKHAVKMWGVYVNDLFSHEDIITDKTLGEHTQDDFKSGYTKAREKYEFTRQDLIDLVESLKDYTAESHNILGHDEREPSEFVDIFLNGRNRTPIAIEVEMVEVRSESFRISGCDKFTYAGCIKNTCTCYKLVPATHPDGTVKVVKWIFNE